LDGFTPLWYNLTMTSSFPVDFQRQFFDKRPQAESLMALFDSLPHTYFYAKDVQSRFIRVNHLFLENHGLSNESEAIGKNDHDFHPPLLAEAYIEEDRRVMASKSPLPRQVWLVHHRRRLPRWYVSSKTPLFDDRGNVIGVAGAMYRIEPKEDLMEYFKELSPVARHIERNYDKPVSMEEMATLVGLSSTHFNRRFQQLLRMTPMQYLRMVRVQAARNLLSSSSLSLVQIAAAVGYTDQSHLTKRFREVTGMTPAAYRKRFPR
jgi:AraC-like DNA-binding protein